jgi:anaerobic selenocysteine-containing dehydrogenase
MSEKHDPLTLDDLSGLDIQRRDFLKVTGAGVAALGALSIFNVPFAKAQDMSNGDLVSFPGVGCVEVT